MGARVPGCSPLWPPKATDLLADALAAAQQRTQDFLEVGVAYVRFALEHRSRFAVMFRPDLYHPDDPAVRAARERASDSLSTGIGSIPSGRAGPDARLAGVAAWSLVHGFATLWLNGAIPPELGDDPEALARAVGAGLTGRVMLGRDPRSRASSAGPT